MPDFIRNLFAADLMPHGVCYLWKPEIVWLHAISDSVITAAYYVIPFALVYFVRRRRDLPFNWMFLLFGIFIFGCGTTHLMEVWTLWNGTYRLAGVVKAITAGASLVTAVLLVRLLPDALALPSPAQLRAANDALEREIGERRRAEAALERARADLDAQVQKRTAELVKAYEDLIREMEQHRIADEERKRAEEKLSALRADMAHVVRVTTMGELAATIAHEVNQPLAGVVTNASAGLRWLAAQPPNIDETRSSLDHILRDGQRASAILERVRGLMKKTTPSATVQNVNDLLREVLSLVHDALVKHRVDTHVVLAENVPAVVGDRVQLQQVILNLVMNGVDAMNAIADRPRDLVVQSQVLSTGEVAMMVRDSGIGVDPTLFERLFEPFFTTKPGGMGMGLSVSRSIVESHGGHLWASANEGPGVTFHVALPAMG